MNIAIKLATVLFWSIFICFVLLVLISSASSQQLPYIPFRSYIVQTASMEPTIMTGDVIFIKPQADYSYQDIITFTDSQGHTITHRISKISNKNGATSFTTKGDNNKTEDIEQISSPQILGKYQARIPKAGYLLIRAQQPIGMVILILLPLIMIIAPDLLKEKEPVHVKKL